VSGISPGRNGGRISMVSNPPARGSFLVCQKLKRAALLAFIVILISCLAVFCEGCNTKKDAPVTPTVDTSESEALDAQNSRNGSVGVPVRITIPKINVDAQVEQVGLTPAGAMDVPEKLSRAAWYRLGTRPGAPGSAVIAGHHSHRASVPAVFDNLIGLGVGDLVYVQDDRGYSLTFSVREIKTYGRDERAWEVFNRQDGRYLNLITCSGTWDDDQKTYDQRLVVFCSCVD